MNLQDVYKIKSVKSRTKRWPRLIKSIDIYNIHAATILIHKSIHEEYGLYDESLECKVDREMWLRLFGKKGVDNPKVKAHYLEHNVAYYRWHSKQVTKKRQKDKNFNKLNIELCDKQYQMRKISNNKKNTRLLNNSG